jgi:hypothetical protein
MKTKRRETFTLAAPRCHRVAAEGSPIRQFDPIRMFLLALVLIGEHSLPPVRTPKCDVTDRRGATFCVTLDAECEACV